MRSVPINDLLRGNIQRKETIQDVKKAAERALSDRAAGGMGSIGRSPF